MKPKRLPRLWCALQGLLPLEECLAAQRAELAWPRELPAGTPGGNGDRESDPEQPDRERAEPSVDRTCDLPRPVRVRHD